MSRYSVVAAALVLASASLPARAQDTTSGRNAASFERCDKPLAVIAVAEPQTAVQEALSKYKLGSPTGLIRLMIQESHCFQIVERGIAMQNVMQERELAQTGQLKQESDMGGGQLVAADFVLTPAVVFSENNAGGGGGLLGGIVGAMHPMLGLIAGGIKFKEAQTSMLLTDARSGLQVAAAEGAAKKANFSLGGLGIGGSGIGALGAYTNTNEGKVITASFVDNFNKIVVAVRADSTLRRVRKPAPPIPSPSPSPVAVSRLYAEGDVLLPKIAGVKLLAQPRDSAKVLARLAKTDEMVFLGKMQDGFLNVQGANAAGWVKEVLVVRRP